VLHRVGEKEIPMGAIADKIKGTAKQIEGKLTGDKVRQAQGTVEKTKGKVEGAASRAVRKVKTKVATTRAKSRARRAARNLNY
jgi:uncharacterized protein YjbJ (UPF0337 family)